MSIKVSKLKDILQTALNTLDELEDDQEIRLVSNTYFLGNPNVFIGIAGYNGGYLNLDEIEDNLVDNDDE